MTAVVKGGKAQNEHMFSGLPRKRVGWAKAPRHIYRPQPMLARGAVPTRLDASRAGSAWAWRACDRSRSSAATGLRAFAHPTRLGGERHGHADAGLELARKNYSPGRGRERNRAEGAAAAGAEFDLE